jgi:signal transduction histidine kinase
MDAHGGGAEEVIMVAVHSPGLVALSLLISLLGAYASIALTERVNSAPRETWIWWLAGTALVDGIGTWSMHYTGKAALRLPVPIAFDWRFVLLSLLVGIAGSAAALMVVTRRRKVGWMRTVLASICLGGIGISGLHFLGMHAMKAPSMHHYSSLITIVSILVAIAIALLSLSLTFLLPERANGKRLRHHASVWFRGAANPAMHYTAMSGVILATGTNIAILPYTVSVSALATVAISAVPVIVLVVSLLISFVDRLRDDTIRLQALSRRLVEVQEGERRQLARALHDRIGQTLTALGINLDILKRSLPPSANGEVHARLEDSVQLVESAAEATENVVADLRPPMLDDLGLLAAVQWYGATFANRTGIKISVTGDADVDHPSMDAKIALFRIVQEALNNIAKHAHATLVEIDLRRNAAGCVLVIRDNGVGFDSFTVSRKQARIGLGMVTMNERAEAIGGSLTVKSIPGLGTQVILEAAC